MFGKAKWFQVFNLFYCSTQKAGECVGRFGKVSTTGCFFSFLTSALEYTTRHTAHTKCVCTQRIIMENCFHKREQSCCALCSFHRHKYVRYSRRVGDEQRGGNYYFPRRRPKCLLACPLEFFDVGLAFVCKLRRRAPFDWMYWNHLSMECSVPRLAKAIRGIASKWISGSFSMTVSAYIVAATDKNELPNWWVRWRKFKKRMSHVSGSVRGAVLFHFSQTRWTNRKHTDRTTGCMEAAAAAAV